MTEGFLQVALTFVEGLALVFSPCILPVLPFVLASSTGDDRRRPFWVIFGFVVSFSFFALLSRQIFVASGISQDVLQKISFVLLLVLGAFMVIPALETRFAALTQKMATFGQRIAHGRGAFVTGCLIGIVWTPCAGPLMGAALIQVLQSKTDVLAVFSVISFAIGAAAPMLAIALFAQRATSHLRFLMQHTQKIKQGLGVVVICLALLGLTGISFGGLARDKTEMPTSATSFLPYAYQAPDIAGVTQWFNSKPLKTMDLRGKVVLVDFWTYSCINCLRTLPHLKSWYSKYKDAGLVVVGVHTPEFVFEGNADNVKKAIARLGISYPVAMDNNFVTWNNFANKYWPAHYLIDRNGRVVYTHFGEGNYNITENNIRSLLGLPETKIASKAVATSSRQTPETYLGKRAEREVASDKVLELHQWKKTGNWSLTKDRQAIESGATDDSLTIRAAAKKVFLVMASRDGKPISVNVTANGKTVTGADIDASNVTVTASRLYEIYAASDFADITLQITASRPGLRLYAFTFEG